MFFTIHKQGDSLLPFPLLVSLHISESVLFPSVLASVYTLIQEVAGRTELVFILPRHTQRWRSHFCHQLGYFCWCPLQFSGSLYRCTTHPWTVGSALLCTLETPKMAISPAFPFQHLPCSIEDEMVIQQPTFYFGHGHFYTSCRLCPDTQEPCSRPACQVGLC